MHRFSNIKFRYNPEKNTKLIEDRGIGFDEIANAMTGGNVIAVTEHFNKEKYPNQKVAYVSVLDKVYVVPYIEEDKDFIFLKTAYPSSKARDLLIFNDKNKR
jgi:uncharacterized DUF497 family protein